MFIILRKYFIKRPRLGACSGRYILTNHPGSDRSKTWSKVANYIESKRYTPSNFINSFINAYRVFRLRKHYDAVMLGGNAKEDNFYLLFQCLWPFLKRPVVKNECLWYKANPIAHRLKRIFFQFLDKVVDCYIVYARSEIEDFSKTFGLPREKFKFIPYHTTLDFDRFHTKMGDYLFSGGNSDRDYAQLAEAVRGLDISVIIACSDKKILDGIDFPSNVKVVSVSQNEYRQLMAESGINVVALRKGLLRSSGHQTFLNAMAMGKPVIVTDPKSAQDYIENYVDGFLVAPSDSDQLRKVIVTLNNNPDLAKRIGKAAKAKALKWDTEAHLFATANLVKSLPQKRESRIRLDAGSGST